MKNIIIILLLMCPTQRREKISFTANKQVAKPVRVEFYTKSGDRVSFKAEKQVTKPKRIEFYAKRKKDYKKYPTWWEQCL